MKKLALYLLLRLIFAAVTTSASAASVTINDSVVSLATNGTKYYTFVDPTSGHFVEVALTMSAYSSLDTNAALTSLDGDTRVSVGNQIDSWEGVNFSASAVTISGGVVANTIAFRIVSVGLRDTGGGQPYWASSATASNNIALEGEASYALDNVGAGLVGTTYSGRLHGITNSGTFQLSDVGAFAGQSIMMNLTFTTNTVADPRTNSWFTTYSGKYARIYTTDANKTAGTAVTTWSNGTQTQSLPAYAGVQEVYSSASWVYIRSTGLGSHIMGPWYLNAAHTTAFPNYPVNQKTFYRIPRTPTVPTTKTLTALGAIGYFVDGISMFDSRDGFVWTGSAEAGNGTGYWNREAYVNEGVTFDPGYAHQENTGNHHYHANPIALRYLLGDHVDYNSTTKTYSESTNAVTQHSPILGWVRDGFPVYGPYGYSSASNSASGIRRMVSGYVLRNGQSGTQNLTVVGRTNIPQWAVRLYNVSAAQSGPTVSTTYPLSRYMEDNDYLGDLGQTQGVGFDLDEYNGRWCVTPEFPGGTYAYFVSISSNGTPTFPYNIGRAFYGNPTGSAQTTLAETVVTNFVGGPNLSPSLNKPSVNSGTVTLTWSAIEGGTYRVESSTNLTSWTTNVTGLSAVLNTGGYTNASADAKKFYRVAMTSLATYDPVSGTSGGGGGGTFAVPGGSVSRGSGTNITLTITLPGTPPSPPANAPITSVTMGSLTATSTSYTTQGTVLANFTIPANATLGAQNVVVTFNIPVFTFTGGFTINP